MPATDPRQTALDALAKLASHRADDRDDWLKTGMALHAVSPDLLEKWDDWSKQSEKFKPGECARQWRGFKSEKGVGLGTLVHMAREDSGDSSIGSAVATASRAAPEPEVKPKRRRTFPTLDDAIKAAARSTGGTHVDSWPYEYADGTLAMWVMRFDVPTVGDDGKTEKQFRPIHQAPNGWLIADPPGKLPLYGLPKLTGAERVYMCEGEKAADAAVSLGLDATTSSHGSKSAKKTDWTPLAGREVVLFPDNDNDGEKYATEVAAILSGLEPAARVKIVHLPNLPVKGDIADYIEARDSSTTEEIRACIEDMAQKAPLVLPSPDTLPCQPGANGESTSMWLPEIIWMNGVEEREWDWLWPDKIPLGALVVFHGHGDLGKSWVCIDMACRASKGVDWPGGVENTHGPIRSLLIGAEDDPERTIIKRINLQEGDASRIGIMSSAKSGDEERMFSLQLDVAGLEQRIAEEGIRLVFIDPITEFYGEGIKGNSNEDIRRVLSPLVKLAQQRSVAIIALTHDGKRETDTARNKALGSVALVNTARVSFYFTADPHDNNENLALQRRLMVPDKGNIFFEKQGLAYRWFGKNQPLVWDADPITQSADEIMADTIQSARENGTPREQAKAFLRDTLADGPVDVDEVKKSAKEEGITVATLKAAKRDMKVASPRNSFGGACQWELARAHSVGP